MGSEKKNYLYPKSKAAILINIPIWSGPTFREICMFSFGKNLAQPLMKYSPIDPPAAAQSSTYGHCSAPSPLVLEYFAWALNSHMQLEETRGINLLSVCLCMFFISQSSREPKEPSPLSSWGLVSEDNALTHPQCSLLPLSEVR